MLHVCTSIFVPGFHGTVPLAASDHVDGEEREYNLEVVDRSEDRFSLTSSNRSSFTSDTDLMVGKMTHTPAHLGIL